MLEHVKEYQKIFTAMTERPDLRAEFVGWDRIEDGYEVVKAAKDRNKEIGDIPVGLIASKHVRMPTPLTPLHMLGDGWRLMSPPTKEQKTSSEAPDVYIWWFEKIGNI